MKYLIDTHVILWAIGKTNELSDTSKKEIENTNNEIFVSSVSLWEISIKYNLGKLLLSSLEIYDIIDYCKELGFTLIPLEPEESLKSYSLKKIENHKDPFDRMLVYQSIKRNLTMISKDERMKNYKKYGLKLIW